MCWGLALVPTKDAQEEGGEEPSPFGKHKTLKSLKSGYGKPGLGDAPANYFLIKRF